LALRSGAVGFQPRAHVQTKLIQVFQMISPDRCRRDSLLLNEGTQLPYDTDASGADKGTTIVVLRNGLISQSGMTKYNKRVYLQVCYIVRADGIGRGTRIGNS
jgi:hypothetical protein